MNLFHKKNIGCGYLYFYIHFITEIVCFYFLGILIPDLQKIWLIPIIYDGLAFVPQSIFGYFNDKLPKVNLSLIGTILLILALILYKFQINIFISLIFLCLGNALIHVRAAHVTIKNSHGKLSHSAIFVAGGSFGVITGKLLASMNIPIYAIILLTLTMVPFILLGEEYENSKKKIKCDNFNYANKKLNSYIVIILAVFVVIIRGYIGYGIPTSWNKTTLQAIIFYSTMGLGKAFGGILVDRFGIKKISILSTLASIPFLCFGDDYMIISLIGVALFSMTMAITLGILVSALKNTPGLAFGLTTIGLFLGTVPIFFVKVINGGVNIALIVISSVLCAIILNIISSEEKKDEVRV